MKKTLLLFAAVFTFGAVASAQVSIIPKAGLTLAKQNFDKTPNMIFGKQNYKNNTGFTGGIGFNVQVGNNNLFSVQPELLYIQKGYQFEYLNMLGSAESKDVYNYLEIPLLGQVRFGTEQIKFFVTAGPSLSYALNGRYVLDASSAGFSVHSEGRTLFGETPENANGDDNYLNPKYYNRTDVGIQAGGGIALAAGPGMLQLEARYGHGLTPFFKGNKDNDSSNDDQANFWNRTFAFTLGYAIPLGGK